MADKVNTSDSLRNKSKYKKDTVVKKYRRSLRTIKRRNRRKRNKVKYYKSLNKLRVERKTSDLCAAVEVFDITDMEWSQSSVQSVPQEVSEWHKQDQIAYWKSRAISLEFENRMLHQHLRDVYAKQIQDYEQCNNSSNRNADDLQISNDSCSKNINSKKEERNDSTAKVLPKIPEGKNRLDEMKHIYGDEAQKIMGMETAIQLNYERHLEKGKQIGYWPNVPLNL